MTTDEVYDLIGKLAATLHADKKNIKLSTLISILADNGCEYGSPRGMGAGVKGAYNHWERKDKAISDAIANVYIDKDGNYAYENY